MVIEYPFSRTTGPVIGAFLTGLREQVLLGIRGADGRVLIPPTEYDPNTGEDLTEMVVVGPGGVVDTWAWVREPMPKHPLQHPFAWALVRPDGAGVGFLQRRRCRLDRRDVHRHAGRAPVGRGARGHHPRPRVLGARSLMADLTTPRSDLGALRARRRRAGAQRAHPRRARLRVHRRAGDDPVPQGDPGEADLRRAGAGREGLRAAPAAPTRSWACPPPSRWSCRTSARSPPSASSTWPSTARAWRSRTRRA